jgi:ribokinase
MASPGVCVVGSIHMDLIAAGPRLPGPGETITGAVFGQHPGGKGANQALAARRLGADVALIGRVGDDAYAEPALALLRQAGVDLSRVQVDAEAPTGIALIAVDAAGENQILVASGASARLVPTDLGHLSFDAVICQLEIPLATVEAAAGCTPGFFCVNAAPVAPLSSALLARTDLVVVNDVEWDALGPALADCRGLVAVTHGSAGATLMRGGAAIARAVPPTVTAIDTVGAGDAFVAALVVGLVSGMTERRALEWACAAGALATTRRGAQPSLPDRHSVDAAVARRRETRGRIYG